MFDASLTIQHTYVKYDNEKFRFFKSKENIHKKEVGPYRGETLSTIKDI